MKPTNPFSGLKSLAVLIGVLTLAASALAQHYPAGVEGVLAASVPPPGLYVRDYNFFYDANRFAGGPSDFNVFVYCNAPRVIWVTPLKILGANYGVDAVVPFGYVNVKVGGMKDNTFGLGDIEAKPVILSWHTKQTDTCLAYGIWMPTGGFDANRMANFGKGYWTHMLAAGLTWYPDQQKTWAISLMSWYEINQRQEHTGMTPGHTYTLEWGASKYFGQNFDVGLVGYVQQQTTANTGTSALGRVVALGPEIGGTIPRIGVMVSVRYEREFAAANHTEGNTAVLTLTKRF